MVQFDITEICPEKLWCEPSGSGPWSHGVVLPFCEAVSDLAEAGGHPGNWMVPRSFSSAECMFIRLFIW